MSLLDRLARWWLGRGWTDDVAERERWRVRTGHIRSNWAQAPDEPRP